MALLLEGLCILLLMFWFVYYHVTRKYGYWKDRGVPQVDPSFPFGNFKAIFLARLHPGELLQKYYQQFKGERYFGIYDPRRPYLVFKDPDLIKRIFTKDFNNFSDRLVFPIDVKTNYISYHLFNMSGPEWKVMRTKLAPTFTTGKMKMMFELMVTCGDQLRNYVDKQIFVHPELDIKDVFARFTMNIIATCAFGLEIDSLSDKDCEFYRYGINAFSKASTSFSFKRLLYILFPFIFNSPSFETLEISNFLTKIVRDTVEYRVKNNVHRNDFLDLLIKISQNKNLLEDEEHTNGNSDLDQEKPSGKPALTIEEMTGQSYIFFVAGFETSSSTMTFCLYELACNPGVQQKLHQEVKQVLGKYGEKLTYQALQDMPYMDQVINETLRRYASLSILNRTCSERYKIPDSDLVVEKGQRIMIPIYAIHHDPEYYPDPYKFDPERFSPENVKKRHPYVHLPFGEGPRMCIGMRFGLLQTKIGLTEMVSNFEFGLTPEVQIPVIIDKRSLVVTQPEKPILLHLTKRKK